MNPTRPRSTIRQRRTGLAVAFALGLAMPAQAVQAVGLEFPGPAIPTAMQASALGSYGLPIGPWDAGSLVTQVTEGVVTESAWRIDMPGVTTLQVMQPLRDQIAREGFRPVFECETVSCGGFDFRYSIRVLPEPDMHVDLGDFRFLSAKRGDGAAAEYLSLLVSRSSAAGFVQMIRVEPPGSAPRVTASAKAPTGVAEATPETGQTVLVEPAPETPQPVVADVVAGLEGGSVALDDLVFDPGAATLQNGQSATLAALATYLAAHPDRSVALVGHTDATGALAANIALSQRRAAAVRDRLIQEFGVKPAQVVAQGVGFLAPRASNLTDEGRNRNRRVEAMLTSTR